MAAWLCGYFETVTYTVKLSRARHSKVKENMQFSMDTVYIRTLSSLARSGSQSAFGAERCVRGLSQKEKTSSLTRQSFSVTVRGGLLRKSFSIETETALPEMKNKSVPFSFGNLGLER